MNNNRQKTTHPEKTDLNKLAGLQKLNLEQLDGVAGGPGDLPDTHGDPPPESSTSLSLISPF